MFKRITVLLLVAIIIVPFFGFDDPKPRSKSQSGFVLPKGVTDADYVPGVIIFKLKNTEAKRSLNIFSGVLENVLSKIGSTERIHMFPVNNKVQDKLRVLGKDVPEEVDLSQVYKIKYKGNLHITEAINEILRTGEVEYAEPSYIYYTTYTPNDPRFTTNEQLYLTVVKAEQAWDIRRTAPNVIIGIVDSGGDLNHPDLAANVYNNPGEMGIDSNGQDRRFNGVDDDGNGKIDDWRGWDFAGPTGNNLTQNNDPNVTVSANDHGVHVAGLASAVSDNSTGIASLAGNAKLLFVKCGSDDNDRAIYNGYEGIKYAADMGAQIINCSWGGTGGSQFGQDIINYATAKGSLVVAAAGNTGKDENFFPASFQNVLAVGRTNNSDVKVASSTFNYNIDIMAPCQGSILSTTFPQNYGFKGGTSMSSPITASAAALVKAQFPNYTPLQVGEQLRATADNIDQLNQATANKNGKGRLNVFRALTEDPTSARVKITRMVDPSGTFMPGTEVEMQIEITNFLKPVAGLTANLVSLSSGAEVLSGTINVGNLNTLETFSTGKFRFRITQSASDNQEIIFRINLNAAGGYSDSEFFTQKVNLDFLNIGINEVTTTATSTGKVGYAGDAQDGEGFVFDDENILFEASFMIGISNTKVSNNARGDANGTPADFIPVEKVKRVVDASADFVSVGRFNDQGNASGPINVDVRHRQFAFEDAPNNRYVIFEYEIENKNSTPLNNMHVAIFADWDIGSFSNNLVRWDDANKIGYMFSNETGLPYGGIKILTNAANPHFFAQRNGSAPQTSGFTTEEKWITMSSGTSTNSEGIEGGAGVDGMYTIGVGPFNNIPAGGKVKVAFAFIGGRNLSDLQSSGNAAQQKYDVITSVRSTSAFAMGFELKQNFPNPVTEKATIEFTIPQRAKVDLSVYNILGEKVAVLVDQELNPGSYAADLNVDNLDNGVYFYTITAGNSKLTKKLLIQK